MNEALSSGLPVVGDKSGIPTPRKEAGRIAVIAAPLAAGYLAEVAMNLTDTVIVGRLGSVELGAVGLASNMLFGLLVPCMSIVSIVGVLAAQAHGAGDQSAIAHAVRQGFWVATLLSIPATAFGLNMGPVLRWLGQEEPVVVLAERYLAGLTWCFLPYMWFTVLRNFVAALARVMVVMVITVTAIGLNLVVVYGLVFGAFGLPALGVTGAGIGTSIVCWAMFAALAVHTSRARVFRIHRVFARLHRVDLRVWREVFRLGLPAAGSSAVENLMFMAVPILMGTIGAVALAANQIAYSVTAVLFMIALGISHAATIRVAYWLGAGSPAAARQAGLVAIGLSVAYMALAAIPLWTLPESISAVYLDPAAPANAEVIALAAALLAIAAVFQIVDGVQVTATGALRGLKDTTVPFILGTVGYLGVGLVGGYVIAFPFGLGATGLWVGLALGLTVSASLLAWRFHERSQALVRSGGL
jgi:MATE family multidrug resistance protein